MKRIIRLSFVILTIFSLNIFSPKTITVSKKEYYAANTSEVSTRELAMLSSLVYENVPDDSSYDNPSRSANLGCNLKSDGSVTGKNGKCFYIALESDTNPYLKRNGKHVYQYVEGLSARKVDGRLIGQLMAAFQEDGEKYYFLNFAKTSELYDSWNIVHYKSVDTLKTVLPDDATFDAITFKKGSNYVIAFRGTDYPDVMEWAEDIAYTVTGEHTQAKLAYDYAQSEYKRIVKENANAKIYVVGHSLGGYLAQVGGAAIIDFVSGRTDPNAEPITGLNNLGDFANVYNPAPNLVQVAYFNGMGVVGLLYNSNFAQNIDNALVYLASYGRGEELGGTGRTVNYSYVVPSSGRLVLYSMEADPVSDTGFHFGEIYNLEVGADAVSNHNGTHSNLLGEQLQQALTKGEVGDISTMVVGILKLISVSESLPEDYYIPEFVSKQINEETGKDIKKYSAKSIATNIDNDLITFYKKYKTEGALIDNLFDHFNMNHETDSFTCIIDKNYGVLDQKNLTIEVNSDTMTCVKNTCYSKTKYKLPQIFSYNNAGNLQKTNYVLGNPITPGTIATSKADNYITLTAKIDGGCVKKYHWEYSTDGKSFQEIGTTVNKTIAIPTSYIETNRNSKRTIQFRVKLDYGDKFYETKSYLGESEVGGNPVIRYAKGSVTSHNPTNGEDITLGNTSGTITSPSKTITYVYDDQAPVCGFEQSSISLRRGKSTTVKFSCSDVSPVKLNPNKFKLSFTLLIDGFDYTVTCSEEGKYCNINITASKNKVFTANNQKITYNDYISDYVGNKTSSKVKDILYLERYK